MLATVVRCEPPASARPGAKAVIRADGSMEGWVGGSCAQSLVVKEALRALREGRPRLLRLSPTAGGRGSQTADLVGVPDDLPQRRHAGDLRRAGRAAPPALPGR